MTLRFGLASSVLIGGLVLCHEATAQSPVAGVAYQVPSAYASVPPGTLIPYGGFNYVAQGNGTMLLAASQAADHRPSHPMPRRSRIRIRVTSHTRAATPR